MIGSIGFYCGEAAVRRLCAYLIRGIERGGSAILSGNMAWERQPPDLWLRGIGNRQWMCHVSLAFDDSDKINNDVLRVVAEDFIARYVAYARKPDIRQRISSAVRLKSPLPKLTKMEHSRSYEELNHRAFLITRHYDTEHRHVHVAFDCQSILDDNAVVMLKPERLNRRLTELILRQLEADYQLKPCQSSWIVREQTGRKGLPLAPYYAKKLGFQGMTRMRGVILEAINHSQDWLEFQNYCKRRGITVEKTGERLVYQCNGVFLKPRQLGKPYTMEEIGKIFDERAKVKKLQRASRPAQEPDPAIHQR